jgi:GNAT superfamily N-acetyltransferase
MAFRLREATESDVPAIVALIALSVRGLQAGDYSAAQIDAALNTVFTIDSRLIADGTYFVVFAESGELVGCGGWSRRKTLYGGDRQVEKVESMLLDPSVDAAKIRAIFVHPRHARLGLGSLILETAEKAAAKEGFRRLEMGSTLTGVALYALKGYEEVDRVAVPVGDGETIEVVRMEKRLSEPAVST